MSRAQALDRREMQRALADEPFVTGLHVVGTVDSTNDEARRLATAGAPPGTVVIAEAQRRGRGRHGRTWHSPPGLGLYLSVLLQPPVPGAPVTRWTLGAAVAACEACRDVGGTSTSIEWPNDLTCDGRKLGGILAELKSGAERGDLVLGTGFNVAHRADDFPPEIRDSATSLTRCAGTERVRRESLAIAFLGRLAAVARRLEAGDWPVVARRWSALAPRATGQRVRVLRPAATDGGSVDGITCGIDADGALLVRDAEGAIVRVHLANSVVPLPQ